MDDSEPPPSGRIPRKKPKILERPMAPRDLRQSSRVGRMPSILPSAPEPLIFFSARNRISPSPKRPTASGTISIPLLSSTLPKVRRGSSVTDNYGRDQQVESSQY